MHRSSSHPSPSRSDRKSIAYITLFFIFVSTIFHFVLGNIGVNDFHTVAAGPTQEPDIYPILTHYQTPTPTPRPQPSPTPKPALVRPRATLMPIRHATAAPVSITNIRPPRQTSDVNALPATAYPDATPGSFATVPAQLPPETVATPESSPTPVEARDMIVAAQFERKVRPEYPPIAVQGHWEGTVVVLVTIGPSGVIEARIGTSSGYPSLDRAALEAAKESTYRPPEVNGKPAIETYRVIYTFTLNDA